LQSEPGVRIDYASAALADNLKEPEHFKDGDEVVLLVAVNLQKVRLIDNLIVKL